MVRDLAIQICDVRKRDIQNRDGGFTLLECIIALVIAGLALAVILSVTQDSLFSARRADSYRSARSLAQSHLALVRAQPALTPGVREGQEDGCHWTETVSRAANTGNPADPAGALYRIRIVTTCASGHARVVLETMHIARGEDG